MTMTVNGPNGVTVNFPDGTDAGVIDRVMREAVQKAGGGTSLDDDGGDPAVLKGIADYADKVFSPDREVQREAIMRERGRQAGAQTGPARTWATGSQNTTLRNFGDEVTGLAEASGLPVGTPPVLSAPIGAVRLALDKAGLTSGDASQRYRDGAAQARGFYEGQAETNPLSSIGSSVVGALPSLASSPLGIAADAAIYGIGAGETAAQRAAYGAGAGALGGTLAKGLQKIMVGGRGASAAAASELTESATAPSAAEVAESAARLGVEMPLGAVTDSMPAQWMGKIMSNVPLVGDPLRKASERAIRQTGEAAGRLADDLGSGTAFGAGDAAKEGIRNYIKTKSAAVLDAAYDGVAKAVRPDITAPLDATTAKVADIMARRVASASNETGTAVQLVLPAVQRPGGLTYQGIKDLRTRVGEMLDGGVLPTGTSASELKSIYAGLSDDLRNAAEVAGGKAGLAAFNKANHQAGIVAKEREALAKIIGTNGDVSAETVASRIASFAGSKSTADLSKLHLVKKALEPQQWDELVSSVVSGLGRATREAEFSPARFLTHYNALSASGKKALFTGTRNAELRQALDDIATQASRHQELAKFANPSGTAQNLSGLGLVSMLFKHPVTALGGVVGGRALAVALSRPATAKSVANWTKAYNSAAQSAARTGRIAGSTLAVASRQLSASLSKELGISISPATLIKLASGNEQTYADEHPEQAVGGR